MLRREGMRGAWQELKRVECAAIAADRDISFDASIGGGGVRLAVDGCGVAVQDVAEDWRGQWGLRTAAGVTAVWKRVAATRGADH